MLAFLKSCLAAGAALLVASSCSNAWAQVSLSKPVAPSFSCFRADGVQRSDQRKAQSPP